MGAFRYNGQIQMKFGTWVNVFRKYVANFIGLYSYWSDLSA